MKLENDPGNLHPSPPRKSYNPFDSDDDALDSPGLKSEIMYVNVKENLNGFDLKAFDKSSSDTVIFHMDNGDFLWEEDVLVQPATDDHAFDANSNKAYSDKNVTECELPEFVICYKESNIKDIVVDVGVPSDEKLWVQSNKTDADMKVEENNNQLGVVELNEEALTGQYLLHEFGDDDLLKATELILDVEDRVCPVAELVADVADHHPTSEKETNHEDDESATIQSQSQLLTEEEIPNKEESLSNDSTKLAYNSKVESRSITFDFGSSTNPKPENQEDDPEKDEPSKPPSAQTMTRQEEEKQEEMIPSSSILLARLEDRVHGETSFSSGMPVPLPSLIAFSEPLTYSGSVSLRSESSAGTASTRSFAFPVLQTEWNSSPVRIGKTGQRHMKKHRGWVQAFSCCKF